MANWFDTFIVLSGLANLLPGKAGTLSRSVPVCLARGWSMIAWPKKRQLRGPVHFGLQPGTGALAVGCHRGHCRKNMARPDSSIAAVGTHKLLQSNPCLRSSGIICFNIRRGAKKSSIAAVHLLSPLEAGCHSSPWQRLCCSDARRHFGSTRALGVCLMMPSGKGVDSEPPVSPAPDVPKIHKASGLFRIAPR